MKRSSLSISLGFCCLAFVAGFGGRRLTMKAESGAPASAESPDKGAGAKTSATSSPVDRRQSIADRKRAAAGAIVLPALHSDDTVESLLALDSNEAYGRIATWMMGASEEEIAAYWAGFKDQENKSHDVTDLVFLNWARLNPEAAIDAVKDGPYNHFAWWAWAAHDPQAAFDAAMAANGDRVNNVVWGIGEFHPEWMRAHFGEIPEEAIPNLMGGYSKWGDTSDPLAMMKFLKDHDRPVDSKTFKALVASDPLAAYDWLKANGAPQDYRYSAKSDAMDDIVKSLAASQPDTLKNMADQERPGEMKRKMEAALFKQLVQTDPDAALEQAIATKSPRGSAERLATFGAAMIQSNPDAAFDAANRMFTNFPDAMQGMVWLVSSPGGGMSGSPSPVPGAAEFVTQLMDADPERTLGMSSLSVRRDGEIYARPDAELERQWAMKDLDAYMDWAQNRSSPEMRPQAAAVASDRLVGERRYQEAADLTASTDVGSLSNILVGWASNQEDEASAWLEASAVPDDQKQTLREFLSRYNKSRRGESQ